jgi:hypothetical protein
VSAARSWASLAGASLLLACASESRGPSFATSEHFPERRTPPSFAAEPAFAPSERGLGSPSVSAAEAFGIRRAMVPLDPEAARGLVGRFFMAVLLESSRDLFPLFAAQAWVLSEGSRQPAQAVWRARLSQLDYTSLSGRIVAAPQTLRTYTFESAARAKRDGVPAPEAPTEVVVVARPGLSWAGKTRLFGEALAFRLRPKADVPGYEIAEIIEDFRLP